VLTLAKPKAFSAMKGCSSLAVAPFPPWSICWKKFLRQILAQPCPIGFNEIIQIKN
jgi:hypothetical protein